MGGFVHTPGGPNIRGLQPSSDTGFEATSGQAEGGYWLS